ncbi:MAG: histidine phosphatase family protein, partial [Acutalibacteraceae bacterium]
MKSYTIHLIRHGICEGNLEGRYVGRTQSPLAREGMQALLELKRTGVYPEAVKYYASPCVRCVDTLKVLYPTADPEVILELAECDFGDWENKKAEELQNDPRFTAWMNGGQHEAPPNGESSIVFMQRVCAGFEMLVRNMM